MEYGDAALTYYRPQALRALLCANLNEELKMLFGSEEAVPSTLATALQSCCEQRDQNVCRIHPHGFVFPSLKTGYLAERACR